jgi:hypothetical protein
MSPSDASRLFGNVIESDRYRGMADIEHGAPIKLD